MRAALAFSRALHTGSIRGDTAAGPVSTPVAVSLRYGSQVFQRASRLFLYTPPTNAHAHDSLRSSQVFALSCRARTWHCSLDLSAWQARKQASLVRVARVVGAGGGERDKEKDNSALLATSRLLLAFPRLSPAIFSARVLFYPRKSSIARFERCLFRTIGSWSARG